MLPNCTTSLRVLFPSIRAIQDCKRPVVDYYNDMKIHKPRVILLIDTSRAYERGLIRGILKYSRLHGPWTLLRRTPAASGGQHSATLSELSNWNADGIIWRESKLALHIEKLGIPTVYAPNTLVPDRFTKILTNDTAIGIMAADHLLGLGLRNFAFYGVEAHFHWSLQRRQGFAQRIKEAGGFLSIYELDSNSAKLTRNARLHNLQNWLSSLPRPFGLMICTDDCCTDCFEACHAAGLDIPNDAAVIGVGNDELVCDFVDPPLSSIAWNIEQTGYEAAEALASLMQNRTARTKDVFADPLYVVARRSTDTMALSDINVATAVQFIREHASQPIHVNDVLKSIPLSRRVLYRRFKEVLGCSIYQEIRRARIDRAARMLLDTNLSVSAIALKLGYEDSKNFSRMFRMEKELTPLKYRKKYALNR